MVPKLLTRPANYPGLFPGDSRHRGSPASAYGYELVNGVPQWNNGTLHLKSVRKAA